MTTYVWLAAGVALPVSAAAVVVLARARRLLPALAGLAALLALTAVFDGVIVGSGVVAYDPARILGVRVGAAPIEDFSYAVVAALAAPALWLLLGRLESRLLPHRERRGGRSHDSNRGGR